PPAVPPLASGLGQVTDLKRRLTMIMRGTTPRALGWRGCLAVLFLGGLLLPLLPTWVPGEPEEEQKPEVEKGVVRDIDPEAPAQEDLKKAEAELRKLEADLRKKVAEIAKARALEARRKAEERRARAAEEKARTAKEAKAGKAIRIEIIVQADGKAEEVKDLIKKVQQALPSARVIMRVENGPQAKD